MEAVEEADEGAEAAGHRDPSVNEPFLTVHTGRPSAPWFLLTIIEPRIDFVDVKLHLENMRNGLVLGFFERAL